MIATLKGKFLESGTVTSKKTGEVFPYSVIYNDKETYQVFDMDGSKIQPFSDVTVEVNVRVNQYGFSLSCVKPKAN